MHSRSSIRFMLLVHVYYTMKYMLTLSYFICLIFLKFLMCYHGCLGKSINDNDIDHKENMFQNYIVDYGKSYIEGSMEHKYRFQNFLVCVSSTMSCLSNSKLAVWYKYILYNHIIIT